MAERVLRTRKSVNMTLDIKVHNRVKEISKETDIPVSRLVDRALQSIVDDYDNKNK